MSKLLKTADAPKSLSGSMRPKKVRPKEADASERRRSAESEGGKGSTTLPSRTKFSSAAQRSAELQ
jgi:hypothetical protein